MNEGLNTVIVDTVTHSEIIGGSFVTRANKSNNITENPQ